MSNFEAISVKEDHTGLVWSGMVSDTLLAELQTGIVPNLLHLVIFDTADGNSKVWEKPGVYKLGDTFDEAALATLDAEVQTALAELSA